MVSQISIYDLYMRRTDTTIGSAPYVTHLDHRVRSRHLKSIPGYEDPDERLSDEQRAEVLAWTAYIEQNLTDLVVRLIS